VTPFSTDKLFSDLLMAMQDRPDRYLAARETTSTVIKQLLKLPDKPLFKSDQISYAAGAVLSRLDQRAWLRYAAEHPSLQR
jgi:transcriptional regulator NrdR family protein